MQSEVRVIQDERTEWRFDLDPAAPMGNAEARDWLDAQFTQLGSEPLRPTGKVDRRGLQAGLVARGIPTPADRR